MTNDPYPVFHHLSQRQLGELFGVSSVEVGRWLKTLGLRTPSGDLSQKALDEGFAEYFDGGFGRFPVWAKEETVALLEKAGHKRKASAPQTVAPVASQPPPPAQPQPLDPQPDPKPLAQQSTASTVTMVGPFTAGRGDDGRWGIVGANGVAYLGGGTQGNAEFAVALLTLAYRCGKLGHPPTP